MLNQVLGVDGNQPSWKAIELLVRQKTPESQRLDYKESSPKNKEFSRDVAAMANGGGGVIVLGVADHDDLPTDIRPVPLTEVSRLQQVFAVNIQPYVPIQFYTVRSEPESDDGVIIIEILASDRMPFAVEENGHLDYVIRVGQHRHPMSESQVEQVYRERFRRHTEIDARIAALSPRLPAGVDHATAMVTVVGVPTSQTIRLFQPTAEIINKLKERRKLWMTISQHTSGLNLISQDMRPRFRRLDFDVRSQPVGGRRKIDGWLEFYDDGAYVSTIPSRRHPMTFEDTKSEVPTFVQENLVVHVIARLASYWYLARHFSFAADITLHARLAHVDRVALIMDPTVRDPDIWQLKYYDYGIGFTRDDSIQVSININIAELQPGPRLIRSAKMLLDDIYTGFGWPECLQLAADGTVNTTYFADRWQRLLSDWASHHGVSWSESRGLLEY